MKMPMKMRRLPLLVALLCASAAPAHADDDILQRVLVLGSRTSQLGVADGASVGTVGQKQLTALTVYRPGELLEVTPGLIVSQHSGEGKANQFYLRGFNLDHGTDLKTTVDEMPVNQRSHAHGQGWTDLNFMIPELAGRLDYRKGPYSAQDGDFASAGTAAIIYASRLPQSLASVTAGQNGYLRTLVAGSPEVGAGSLLYALEALHNDGPFVHPDDYQKLNGVLRYSQGFANNGFSVTAMAYHGAWNATDQLPRRAVAGAGAGATLDRFDTIDPTDGGSAHRYSLSGLWRRTGSDSSSKASAYIVRNQLDLFSNFTYFLDDPVNGDQFSQPDRRVTSGANVSHTWHRHADGLGAGVTADLTVGAQLQNDNIVNGLNSTRARATIAVTRADHVVETSGGVWLEGRAHWTDWLRTTAGVRFDSYRFKVQGALAANNGAARDSIASPSINVALGPWRQTELYVNAGSGFHSNDARGVLTTVDPKSGEATPPVPGLVRSRGLELGLRSEIVPTLQTTFSVYRLDFASELVFVGDAGTTEAGRPSRRTGVELSNYWKPFKWLSVDADAAFARARYRDSAPEGERIPGAIEGVGQLAVTVDGGGPWSGSVRLRYFGPRPLIEDDSVRSSASLTINGRLAYKISRGVKIELEGFNLANRRVSAIDYYYASRLKNEAAPVTDIHFHPLESRSARVTLVKTW